MRKIGNSSMILVGIVLIGFVWIIQSNILIGLLNFALIVFGWGVVVLGLLFEVIYRNGIGNVLASVAGFGALLVAHFLSGDGDTITVLIAVLDTQFWLATHVVCIPVGEGTA